MCEPHLAATLGQLRLKPVEREYARDVLVPALVPMVRDLLEAMPSDPERYLAEWLRSAEGTGAGLGRASGPPGSELQRAAADDSAAALREEAVAATADHLAGCGFSVRQLLEFCREKEASGQLSKDTTTEQLVRDVVIPETAEAQCCYMLSDFMVARGGPQRARKLVSHAWSSLFLNTVANIVVDATEMDAETLRREFFSAMWYMTGWDLPGLISKLEMTCPHALDATYWLCIFGVNEHAAICGDCWTCNGKAEWLVDPQSHCKANPCLLCGGHKFNPCACGARKLTPADPAYEIDKFDDVVQRMDALVVSLDSSLVTTERIWVVAEIVQAIHNATPVTFRLLNKLDPERQSQVARGEALVPPVAQCKATSMEDKRRILEKVDSSEGGREAYDAFVNCLLEMRFGRCTRLAELCGDSAKSLEKVKNLDMDLSWRGRDLECVEDLLGKGAEFQKMSLQTLRITIAGRMISDPCRWRDITELAVAIGTQTYLEDLSLDFKYCPNLGGEGFATLPLALASLSSLRRLVLLLDNCSGLKDPELVAVFRGLPPRLEELDLELTHTELADEGGAAIGENLPRNLRKLKLKLNDTKLGDVGAAGIGRGLPLGLEELTLDIYHANMHDEGLVGIGRGLPASLRVLNLHVGRTYTGDAAATALAEGLPKGLRRLELDLAGAKIGDTGAEAIAGALPDSLEALKLYLGDTEVGDKGSLALARSLPEGLKELVLRLSRWKVSPDAKAQVKQEVLAGVHPDCKPDIE